MQMIPAAETMEFCYVKYYQAVGYCDLTVDDPGQFLSYNRLLWERKAGIMGELYPGKEFWTVPCDSIQGRCHVARADSKIELLSSLNVRR